jgi:hypothetical protein
MPMMDVPTSRFRKSSTTFGPLGRTLATIAVLLPSPIWFVSINTAFFALGLWGLLGHTIVATIVLKSVWRPVRIEKPDELPRFLTSLRGLEGRSLGWLGRPVRLPKAARIAVGVALAGVGAIVVSRAGEGFSEYAWAAAVLTVPVGLLLAWLCDQ